MTICEYCGRVHQATEIDRRFCSLLCRTQYENAPGFYTPDALRDEQQRQGQLLRTYVVTILRTAGQLLRQTESHSPEQQLSIQRGWLSTIAAQEVPLLSLCDIFDGPSVPPPPAAE